MFEDIEVLGGMQLYLANETDLQSIKDLDDLAFGHQHGVSLDELNSIKRAGGIILLRERASGLLLGESQVLLSQFSSVPYPLHDDEAFYYGTAVHPSWQGRGFGKILAAAQDNFARTQNKTKAALTVRVENYASIKLRLECDFLITAYLPNFYGQPEENGARLLMTKEFRKSLPFFSRELRVPVTFGGSPDLAAHRMISETLAAGYQGYKVYRGKDNSAGFLSFGK